MKGDCANCGGEVIERTTLNRDRFAIEIVARCIACKSVGRAWISDDAELLNAGDVYKESRRDDL